MATSEFLKETEPFEQIESLPCGGSTSLCYRVRKDGKDYFMKKLRPEFRDNQRYRMLFHKELEIGQNLRNKYFAKYLSLHENKDDIYLIMDFINGQCLEETLKVNPGYFTIAHNYEKFFIQLLKGLRILHSKNIAYLDLKPENILLTQVNNDVKIIDLGFCLDDTYGQTAGYNKDFAAPELFNNNGKDIDARSDIYSFGKLMLHINEICGIKHISLFRKKILNRCTQENPEDRFSSVDEILRYINRRKQVIIFASFTLVISIVGFFFGFY